MSVHTTDADLKLLRATVPEGFVPDLLDRLKDGHRDTIRVSLQREGSRVVAYSIEMPPKRGERAR